MYSSSYTDMSNTEGSVLGTLECLTQNSPPTTVTWLRDGVAVLEQCGSHQQQFDSTEVKLLLLQSGRVLLL